MAQTVFSQEYVYTSQNPTMLREHAKESAKVIQEVPQGEKLIVIEKQADWIKVLYNTAMGYIAISQLSFAAPPDQIPFVDIEDLRKQYKNNQQTMTKIKFQSWWEDTQKSLMNHQIRSHGYVEQAKEGWVDGLHVQMNVDPLSENTVYDIVLLLNKERHDNSILAKLVKGELLEFTGYIESINTPLGAFVVRVKDVELLFKEQADTLSKSQETSPSEEHAPASEELDIAALLNEYKSNKEKMTKAGFEAWWNQTQTTLKAKESIRITGYVYDASKVREGISLDVNVFPESERDQYARYGRQCSVILDETSYKDRIATLQKYDVVEFTGKISDLVTSLGLFIVEMNKGELVDIQQQTETNVNVALPVSSQGRPPIFDFAELQTQYAINEGKLTEYGFKTWKELLNALISDNIITSQGTVLEARIKGENTLEVQVDIHRPSDQKSEILLRMDKGANQDIIMTLDKGTPIRFTGYVKWWSISAKKVNLQIENGMILKSEEATEISEKSVTPQEVSDDVQTLTSNDLLCKFVLGLMSDDVILTNNSGRDMNNVTLTITLDEGSASDTIRIWRKNEPKKYNFKGVRTTKTIQIELSSDEGKLSHAYPSGH